jgi:hypothetical protein
MGDGKPEEGMQMESGTWLRARGIPDRRLHRGELAGERSSAIHFTGIGGEFAITERR